MTRDEAEYAADEARQFPVPAATRLSDDSPIGGRTLVGGAWTTAAQDRAPYVFTTAVSIVAGRILGPSGLGRQSFIAFAVLVVMTACSGGLALALQRSSAEALGGGTGAREHAARPQPLGVEGRCRSSARRQRHPRSHRGGRGDAPCSLAAGRRSRDSES